MIYTASKKLLLLSLPILSLSGCTLQFWSDSQVSSVQDQLSWLNQQNTELNNQIQVLSGENAILKQENESLKTRTWDENVVNTNKTQIGELEKQVENLNSDVVKCKTALLQEKINNKSTEIQNTGTNTQINNTAIKSDRYRKIYSTNYSLSEIDNTNNSKTYKICLASDKNICIDLIQYNSTFSNYYKWLFSDSNWKITITTTINGEKIWKCWAGMYESKRCYNESSNWTLIMNISDQRWEWFNWWVYDPKEILKVIDF